jgi:hypothetical protein
MVFPCYNYKKRFGILLVRYQKYFYRILLARKDLPKTSRGSYYQEKLYT